MSPASWRRVVLWAAAVLLVASLIIAVFIIPGFLRDTFAEATPVRAVRALRFVAFVDATLAGLLLIVWVLRSRRRLSVLLLDAVALVALLLCVAFFDGATAVWGHGPAMHPVSVAMFLCVAGNACAAILAIAARRIPG